MNIEDNKILVYSIIITLIFFLFIFPLLQVTTKNTCNEEFTLNNYNKFTQNNYDDFKLDKAICSKSCCKFDSNAWPYPFNTRDPRITDEELENYIPNNFSCNNGYGSGCPCMTKDNFNYLVNHGQIGTDVLDNKL
jgi:hypothetical protein